MALDAKHPLYGQHVEDWATMRDLYEGERVVKEKGETYLPATSGMRLDGMETNKPGRKAYDAYKKRAVFHDYVREGVEKLIGVLHEKPANITLPSSMEGLRTKATISGESLDLLLRRINEEQLVSGRLGLLADLPLNPDPANPLPYIALYIAESAINWDDGSFIDGFNSLNLVVLNESAYHRQSSFEWKFQEKYRVLQLGLIEQNEADGTAVYMQGTFLDKNYNFATMTTPMLRGKALEQIPFVFVNSKDIVATPDKPPLMGLGRLALAIYRGEADYRQNLYMQGQDTLVTIGGVRSNDGATGDDSGEALRVGAGSRIDIEMGGDAKYIGVNSQGLAEQRQALDADKKEAATKAGQLINNNEGNSESGEALKIRVGAQTASLIQIAKAGAAGLEQILKIIAEWMGANPDEVKVEPNVEFSDFELGGQELVYLMTARGMGAPLSKQSIHGILVEKGLTKLDYETELSIIDEEDAQSHPIGTKAGGNPGGTGAQ